jgi:hypothetical protein
VASPGRPQVPGGNCIAGLPEGYDKLVVADIIVLLIEALKGIGTTDNKLVQAHTKADHHNPRSPRRRLIERPPHSAVSDFLIGCVKGVFDVNM